MAQNLNFYFGGKVSNYDSGKKEGGATIDILQNGQVIGSAQTASNGKYQIEALMPDNGKFEVVFKKPGYVTKKVKFDYSSFVNPGIPDGDDYALPVDLDMAIFAEKPGLDFSFLNREPVASFTFDPQKMVPSYDEGAMRKTKAKIEDLINSAAKKANADLEKFNLTIKEADAFYQQQQYESAKAKYAEALKIREGEPHPTKKNSRNQCFN